MIIRQQYLMKESLCKKLLRCIACPKLEKSCKYHSTSPATTQQYKSYFIFADPSLMLAERLRLMMARDPSELAILGHLSSCCSLILTPDAMRFGKTLQLCVIINLSFTKSGKERVSRASASLFWKLHVLSK